MRKNILIEIGEEIAFSKLSKKKNQICNFIQMYIIFSLIITKRT